MLVRLIYASRATEAAPGEAMSAILRASRSRNPSLGVTGVLCQSADVYLQVLEGGRDAVSTLYHRIARDPRHRDPLLLAFDEIVERRYAGWSMGQVNLQRLNPAVLVRFSETAQLDPWSMPAAATLALFDELVASASIMA